MGPPPKKNKNVKKKKALHMMEMERYKAGPWSDKNGFCKKNSHV